ncbi:T9SS type A sorting domain-containing protein [bacterium]|nr:T9SS type A sorting domain-containing protein [bacterium]
MKKKFMIITLFFVFTFSITANTNTPLKSIKLDEVGLRPYQSTNRYETPFEFAITPISIMENYYDYFPGTYGAIPMMRADFSATGGINGNWIIYHAKATQSSTRRIYKAFVDVTGSILANSTFNTSDTNEGYAGLALTEGGRPVFAYHGNWDASDPEWEVGLGYDAVTLGIAINQNSDLITIIDSPTSIVVNGTTYSSNEFNWPSVQIGPSPVEGHQRVYVCSRNGWSASGAASENPYIIYHDFTEDEIENHLFQATAWESTTIPELDEWNVSTGEWRRPFMSFIVVEDKLFYIGHHFAAESSASTAASINEPSLDVFVCDNYGEGQWERYSIWDSFDSYNPNYINPTGFHEGTEMTEEYFDTSTDDFSDEDMHIGIGQSSHFNLAVDNYGRIHMPALYTQKTYDGSYYPALHVIKTVIFDPSDNSFKVNEVYPQTEQRVFDITGNTETVSSEVPWLWWDTDGDGIIDEIADDGTWDNEDDGVTPADTDYWGMPLLSTMWPFPYWDETAGTDQSALFHLNHIRITNANEFGMMAMLWHDTQKSRNYNKSPDVYPELQPYGQNIETMISVSADNGATWSEPFSLNSVEVPELEGQIPTFVYPTDKMEYIQTPTGTGPVGRLHLMYLDDYTYGSYEQGIGQATGGMMMYTAIDIDFASATPNTDINNVAMPSMQLKQNYPNPFNPVTTIDFDMKKAGDVQLSIYNIKGQLVNTLVKGNLQAGNHSYVWKGNDLKGNQVSSGLYFYKLSSSEKTETKKMVLMK